MNEVDSVHHVLMARFDALSTTPGSIRPALAALAHPRGPSEPEVALAPLDGPDREEFVRLVRENRLHGALMDAVKSVGGDTDAQLLSVIEDDRLTRLRVGAVLGRAAAALDAADITWLTFKGPVISSLMERPELRTFNDLDLLVAATQFRGAIKVLADAGFEELNQNWEPYIKYQVGEVPLVAQATTIDLHWHLIALLRERRTVRFDPRSMLERRRTVRIGDLTVPTFDVEDQMLHLATHSALAGATRFDQLRDIAVLVGAGPVDWDEFTIRARVAGVARLVAHPLDRARAILGADVPADVVEALGGRALAVRRVLDKRGSLRGGFAVAVWRDRWQSTARVASERAIDRVSDLLGRGPAWDFIDPNGTLYYAKASGGPASRDEYLRGAAEWI